MRFLKILFVKLNLDNLKTLIYVLLLSFSLFHFYLQINFPSEYFRYIEDNKLPIEQISVFLKLIFITSFFSVVLFVLTFILDIFLELRSYKFSLLNKLNYLKIFICIFFVPTIVNKDLWMKHELLNLVLLNCVLIFLYFIVKEIIQTINNPNLRLLKFVEKPLVFLLLMAGILGYTIYFGYYTVYSHYQFQTAALDLAINVNYFWNTFIGLDFMKSQLTCQNYFTAHIELTPLILIGPMFIFLPIAETLLVAQCAYVALGAIPIYLISNYLIKNRWISLIFALAYLFNPYMQSGNFYDYHQLSSIPFVLGFLIYFYLKKKKILYYVFLVLFIFIKEDMALMWILISLYIILADKNIKTGVISIFISLSWFSIIKFIITPYFGLIEYNYYYSEMLPYGGGFIGMIQTMMLNPYFTLSNILKPDKIIYLLKMLSIFAFIQFFRVRYIVFFIYGLSVTILATHKPMYETYFQYVWYLITPMWIAVIFVIRDIKEKNNLKYFKLNYIALIIVIIFSTISLSYVYGGIFNTNSFRGGFRTVDFDYNDADKEKYDCFTKLISIIPSTAYVSAAENLCSHLSTRSNINTFRFANEKEINYLDYILLHSNNSEGNDIYSKYVKNNNYFTQIKDECGWTLFKSNRLINDITFIEKHSKNKELILLSDRSDLFIEEFKDKEYLKSNLNYNISDIDSIYAKLQEGLPVIMVNDNLKLISKDYTLIYDIINKSYKVKDRNENRIIYLEKSEINTTNNTGQALLKQQDTSMLHCRFGNSFFISDSTDDQILNVNTLRNEKQNNIFYTYFDGNNESFLILNKIIKINNEFTIEIIINPSDQNKGLANIISNHPGKYLSNYNGFAIEKVDDINNKYYFTIANGKRWHPHLEFSLLNNKWSYLVITSTNEFIEVYVDGEKVNSINREFKIKNSKLPLMIGNWNAIDRPFKGKISEVHLISSYLSGDDIKHRYINIKDVLIN